jgi:ATP-dependent helicase/nuclease subunit A
MTENMNKNLTERVVASFRLTPDQRAAALERGRDVVVTAGAGSGKTRTLVARYAGLLADGCSPRRVAAITFTKKAAREMRSRVRQALTDLAQQALDDTERQYWVALSAQMDSARIGTIHSLCSEILRAHPAEAGIDPRFEVLDEGRTALLRHQIVTDSLPGLVERPEFELLLGTFSSGALEELLFGLLNRRLEAREAFEQPGESRNLIRQELERRLNSPRLAEPVAWLREALTENQLQSEGDKLSGMVQELLGLWQSATESLAGGDVFACIDCLFQARRTKMNGTYGRKDSLVKETVKELKAAYDNLLDPLLGGSNAKSEPPKAEDETRFELILPLLRMAFEELHCTYTAALDQQQALDFDDLEYRAQQLLKLPELRIRWQSELQALLVDEFQDTNLRQREIVEALAGAPQGLGPISAGGRLFVVGDSRQSIYRFRRADVTVFREVQAAVRQAGGLVLDLNRTYRAHADLLAGTGDLLSVLMGTEPDQARPYYVPFSPLQAERQVPAAHLFAPHVEIVLGLGEDSAAGRLQGGRALAKRLLQLKAQGQIQKWDDVALLFRASGGFAAYENAFEENSIPFVTVAGRGFYDRAEIRDLLNLLRALADPTDDLALAGLLRSPAFGLTDAALYLLRQAWQTKQPYWTALQADLSLLDQNDRARAERAVGILRELLPLVDRVPVAELLKKLVDAVDYRAILASADTSQAADSGTNSRKGTGGRLWRNLDKLLEDAQSSQQVNVRDFLEYLTTLNEAGAREGEAPAEAGGAVRLMTIHKSKGLEFPLVVLADAGRKPMTASETVYLLPGLGLSLKLDPMPFLYRLSRDLDQQQGDAETRRLLYVALTRAAEKLIISGHMTLAESGVLSAPGWMGEVCQAAGLVLDNPQLLDGQVLDVHLASGQVLRAWCLPPVVAAPGEFATEVEPRTQLTASDLPDIFRLLPGLPSKLGELGVSEDEAGQQHIWRATASGAQVPPAVLGKLVHKAIELWIFPDDPRLIPMLEAAALNAGLAALEQRLEAVRRARELLERFQLYWLWEELEKAEERHHELPYSRLSADLTETGFIDLLYRTERGWQILDFKTDVIHSPAQKAALVLRYSRQMARYVLAVEKLLRVPVLARMCFLDDQGRISLVDA